MTEIIKAERKDLIVGGVDLPIYQIPSGEYKMSGRNVTDAIGKHHSSLAEIMGVKTLKDLPHAGFDWRIAPVGKGGAPFEPVSIQDAVTYWSIMSKKGNDKAAAILAAYALETIERRADIAFGVVKTEAVYEQQTKKSMSEIATVLLKDGIDTKAVRTVALRVYNRIRKTKPHLIIQGDGGVYVKDFLENIDPVKDAAIANMFTEVSELDYPRILNFDSSTIIISAETFQQVVERMEDEAGRDFSWAEIERMKIDVCQDPPFIFGFYETRSR